ncbi:MAG: hypothetical protein JST00_13220 [Deltaproteobacteria bacterium]|nr:hypothetical protein [Deltaproteobacteria bacterium]
MSSAKQDGAHDRRKSERRRTASAKPAAERRELEQRGVGTAMVDALEDILKWERASERALKVASASTSSLDNLPSN